MVAVHPSIMDHSPKTLRRLSNVCREVSHDQCFDDLQDAANLLWDWAMLRDGIKLIGLDGTEYPVPVEMHRESKEGSE